VVQMAVREIIQCFAHIYFSYNFLSIMMCQTLSGLYKTLVLCNDHTKDVLYSRPQGVAQSAGTTPNEADVTSSNLSPLPLV
jgi:hypothetical protein